MENWPLILCAMVFILQFTDVMANVAGLKKNIYVSIRLSDHLTRKEESYAIMNLTKRFDEVMLLILYL
jgi:hypothetical protein